MSKIDLSGWRLDAVDVAGKWLEEQILSAVSEVIQITADQQGVYADIPLNPEKDPLIVKVVLPWNDGKWDPVWEFSLADLIGEVRTGRFLEDRGDLLRLRHALAAQVESLDAVLAKA